MTLRDEALATLRAWQPPSEEQDALRDRFVAHLVAHEDGMWRSCAGAHLTCGVLVVSDDAEQVLLNLHGKAGIWVAFGGHCEDGDRTLLEAATRELREESGLSAFAVDPVIAQLDVHPVDFCRPHGHVEHFDVRFVARAAADGSHRVSEESSDVRWFPVGVVPTRERSILDLIGLAQSTPTWPGGSSIREAADQPSR